MIYDLNIVWTPQTAQADLVRALQHSKSFGYDVVALNHIIRDPIPAQITNPIPQIGPAHPSFPPPLPHQQPGRQPPTTTTTIAAANNTLPITLSRATVVVDDPATNQRLSTLAATYDLVAVRPTTDKAFAAACTSMSEISLISLDLSTSQPFRYKPKPCMAAVHRGVLFEVCYAQVLHQADGRARANFVANVLELVRATKGRGIVLSSEARVVAAATAGGLRAPADVVNLLACWGLASERGTEALGENPRLVVANEALRRRSYRGVVDIVQAAGRIPAEAGKEAANNQGGGKHKQQQQQQHQHQQLKRKAEPKQLGGVELNGNGKRKHDEAANLEGGETSLPVLSKRQAKKQRMAAKKTADGAPADAGE